MLRWIILVGVLLGLSALLLSSGWLPAPLQGLLAWVQHTMLYVVIPIFLVMFLMAPGLFPSLSNEARSLWQRMSGRETTALQQKIKQLDKPHHMVQLANVYLNAARFAKAEPWYAQALERDPSLLEARYKLGLCKFHAGDYAQAEELLEQVHAEKPDYDYGMAYLRLAQTHARLKHAQRAEEIFLTMLRFYPGHAEASYSYGLLLASEGRWSAAQEQMRNINTTLKLAPPFQRRRNRHWALKAWWWLIRNGKQQDAEDAKLAKAGTEQPADTPDATSAQDAEAAGNGHAQNNAGSTAPVSNRSAK